LTWVQAHAAAPACANVGRHLCSGRFLCCHLPPLQDAPGLVLSPPVLFCSACLLHTSLPPNDAQGLTLSRIDRHSVQPPVAGTRSLGHQGLTGTRRWVCTPPSPSGRPPLPSCTMRPSPLNHVAHQPFGASSGHSIHPHTPPPTLPPGPPACLCSRFHCTGRAPLSWRGREGSSTAERLWRGRGA